MERLDRNFVSDDLINVFPKTVVIHLPKTHSNHNPLLIQLTPRNIDYCDKPFRLETIWCRHSDFVNIVRQYRNNNDLIISQRVFKEKTNNWKHETFGDIFKKRKKLLAHLNGIQSSPAYYRSDFLQDL